MHADRLNASFGEEVSRNLENALPMLGCITPFVPFRCQEQLWSLRSLLTSGQLSATLILYGQLSI
jgi:hypothetical protein